MSLAARAVLALVLLALAAAGGWRQGVKSTLADWRAAELATAQAQAESLAENARFARQASTTYETTRAALTARQPETRRVIVQALQVQAQCPPAGALGDVVVPAAALDGLRRAAGQAGEGGTAAAEPVPAVR